MGAEEQVAVLLNVNENWLRIQNFPGTMNAANCKSHVAQKLKELNI